MPRFFGSIREEFATRFSRKDAIPNASLYDAEDRNDLNPIPSILYSFTVFDGPSNTNPHNEAPTIAHSRRATDIIFQG
jgi:hypothetical protein